MKEMTAREKEIREELQQMSDEWKAINEKRGELEKELRDLVKDRVGSEYRGKCYVHENEQNGEKFKVYIRILECASEAAFNALTFCKLPAGLQKTTKRQYTKIL